MGMLLFDSVLHLSLRHKEGSSENSKIFMKIKAMRPQKISGLKFVIT